LLPLYLIKVDKDTGEPIRDKYVKTLKKFKNGYLIILVYFKSEGFCIPCEPHEPGEFIGRIVRGDPVKDFEGYKDNQATKKKVLHNVFQQGDEYFR